MSVDHYENFPVASWLMPRRLRGPVRDIYRYARTADDIADEGDDPPDERLRQLSAYRQALQGLQQGLPPPPRLARVFEPLARSIEQHELPLQPFYDLLSAFEQDVMGASYEDDAALLDYCARSANPVGRLLLHLYGAATPDNLRDADRLCTGLQWVNFWQDVALDWSKGRVYLPRDRMREYGVDDAHIAQARCDAAWQALMQDQVARTRPMLLDGLELARRLSGRLGMETRLIALGGLRILERLDALHYDVFRHRPTLRARDGLLLIWRALIRAT